MTGKNIYKLCAPAQASVASLGVKAGQPVRAGQPLMVLEAMKMLTTITAPIGGKISSIVIQPHQIVEKDALLLEIIPDPDEAEAPASKDSCSPSDSKNDLIAKLQQRKALTEDTARTEQAQKRHKKGFRTARENLNDLCDDGTFQEYGQFAVAAQRGRKDYEQLKSATAADGIITGIGTINGDLLEQGENKVAIAINDYSVLAGTQGYFHHLKLDRILATAKQQSLPVVMFTEGGGGRPGDTDITTVNSGLNCQSFSTWAGLSGQVPRISVNNGYCFAGNAALFGAADITIATEQSYIGMAGPAMIEGGGLGQFTAEDIGPTAKQCKNGVVDIVAKDEKHATAMARRCLSYFQGNINNWKEPDQARLRHALPEDRRFAYDIYSVIEVIADKDSFTQLRKDYGGAIITGFIRVQGKPLGLMANNCKVLGGAIDVDAGEKAARFMEMCNTFDIPLISLCDTPGFMVGPSHEEQGAVRRLAEMFTIGAKLHVPLVGVVLRKCYGLGAQAMLGGSTSAPLYTVSWPQGEFGPMGLEGAVKLGFKQELAAHQDAKARQALYDKILKQQYARGQATEVASVLEIDAVIDPTRTREVIRQVLL